MIKVEGLTRWFDGTLAVDSLTLEVREGEIFGLLGPNGAGIDHHGADVGLSNRSHQWPGDHRWL